MPSGAQTIESEALTSPRVKRHRPQKSWMNRRSDLERVLGIALLICVVVIVALSVVLVRVVNKSADVIHEKPKVVKAPESDRFIEASNKDPPQTGGEIDRDRSDVLRSEEDPEQKKYLRKVWTEKISRVNGDFAQRFPRDQWQHHRAKVVGEHLPKALRLSMDPDKLTKDEKVAELLENLDEDGDGDGNPWELHDWMLWIEKTIHKHVLQDQWRALGMTEGGNMSWPDYQAMVNPYGVTTSKERRRLKRDRRRWRYADNDGDNILNIHEFKYFLFPQISPSSGEILIPEAHAELDNDYDGRISEGEFLVIHKNNGSEHEALYFRDMLDKDGSGFLDIEEIASWVEPEGFVQAKSEVIHLMHQLDTDKDKVLSKEEIMKNPELFLRSQVTFYGELYKLENLPAEVFAPA